MTTVDSIIESFPEKQAAALAAVRSQLHELLPTAIEDLSWGMPTLRVQGIIVMSFLGFSHHNSLFPGPEVQELLGSALDGYTTTKGTIHFDQHKAPPKAFLRQRVTPCTAPGRFIARTALSCAAVLSAQASR
jgi:uncharacterized protein YdhG (YjbR/CyaY superfamily)